MLKTGLILLILSFALGANAQNAKFVQGIVKDAKTLSPLDDIDLIIYNSDSSKVYQATTDENGKYLVKNVTLDKYTIQVNDET